MKRHFYDRKKGWVVLMILTGMILLTALPAIASIAKVTSFKGEVIVASGGQVDKVTAPGLVLKSGDIVQTKDGEVQIAFNDGAVMKVNPYTKTMIQEAKEQRGTWLFKTTEKARRVTCYVGKLWFKSGASGTKNYLQSPTAVAGLRGSDGDLGYDPARLVTLLNMYSGEAAVVGNVIRGFFESPGASAAQKSAVYQKLEQAYSTKVETEKASATVASASQKVLNTASVEKIV
jgi:hypothetical protein